MPTPSEMVEWNGKQVRLVDLSKQFGQDPRNVRHRIRRGWTLHEALTTPKEYRSPQSKTIERSMRNREADAFLAEQVKRETAMPWER